MFNGFTSFKYNISYRGGGIQYVHKKLKKINKYSKFTLKNGPVDKLKKNDLLYGIIIISIAGGHFYDGKADWENSDDNS